MLGSKLTSYLKDYDAEKIRSPAQSENFGWAIIGIKNMSHWTTSIYCNNVMISTSTVCPQYLMKVKNSYMYCQMWSHETACTIFVTCYLRDSNEFRIILLKVSMNASESWCRSAGPLPCTTCVGSAKDPKCVWTTAFKLIVQAYFRAKQNQEH